METKRIWQHDPEYGFYIERDGPDYILGFMNSDGSTSSSIITETIFDNLRRYWC